jgi:predicted regulator of Ras-like GTPase activity (Roadblock/LC7/MglB family)
VATPFDIDWDKAGKSLQSLLNDIQAIEGYLAFALVDSEGKILASDQNKFSLNMRILARDLLPLFSSAQQTAERINIKRNEALTLHSQSCTIIMQFFQMNLFIIVVCQPAGKWFEMKHCIDSMASQLMN